MEDMDFWRLCDELSVVDAALLIAGHDPALIRESIESSLPRLRPSAYDAAKAALTNAINAGRLPATIRRDAYRPGFDQFPAIGEGSGETEDGTTIYYNEMPNWLLTTIELNDLKKWLSSRGFSKGFFFPDSTPEVDYLNPNNENYAPKLAAAVKSWQAVTSDENLLKGKTPKQALDKWLREHASQFELTDDEGNPNNEGILQISKVANWRPEGGAAKTPANNENLPTPLKHGKN